MINEDTKNDLQEVAEYVQKARQSTCFRSFFWLIRCTETLKRYAGMEVGKKDNSLTGLVILQTLLKYPDDINQQSIAEKIGRTKQAVVVAIDNLAKNSLLLRCSNSKDRRINSIQITPKGLKHIMKYFPVTVEMCNKAFSSLDDSEINQILLIVIKLTKNLSAISSPGMLEKMNEL